MFRTEIEAFNPNFLINHQSKILNMGSCFSENIGQKLVEHKFDCSANPFTIFHPNAILSLLQSALTLEPLHDDLIIEQDGLWLSHQLHSTVKGETKEDLKEKYSSLQKATHARLKSAHVVMLTFGTAFAYKLLKSKQQVANCHKVPQKYFSKELVNVDDIISGFGRFYNKLKIVNPEVKFVLTVSPVRHTKDSLKMNSVSKSILRMACHELETLFKNVCYFPAYEVMQDDLRDYRFYAADMIHPNQVAIDYIWQKFSNSFFDQDTLLLNEKWSKLKAALAHKAFNPKSEKHQQFLKKTLSDLVGLSNQLPLEKEIEQLKSQIL